MADKEVTTKLILQGDAGGMVAAMDKGITSLNGITGATQQAETRMLSMASAIPVLAAAIGTLNLAKYISDSAMLAARVETLGVVMKVVGNNAGYTGAEMARYAQDVAAMGITTEVSRQTVVKMASAHMDLTKASELARIAQDAAVIGNINSSEAFEKMIYGIQSGQTDVLKTIGINVQFEDSYKRIAATLGKTSNELTENEKIQARTNVVLDKGKDIAGAYAASMDTAGKIINSMKRPADEIALSIGGIFTPTLNMLAKDFYNELTGVSKALKDGQPAVDAWGNKTLEVTITVKAEFMRLALVVDKIGGSLTTLAARAFTVAGVVTRAVTIGQFGKGLEDRAAGMKEANDLYAQRYASTEAELVKLAEKYNQIGQKPAEVADKIRQQADEEAVIQKKKPRKGKDLYADGTDLLRNQILTYQRDMEKINTLLMAESAAMAGAGNFAVATFSGDLTTGDRYKKSGAYSLMGEGPNTVAQMPQGPANAEDALQARYAEGRQEIAHQAALVSEQRFLVQQAAARGDFSTVELDRIDREQAAMEQSWAMNTDSYATYEARLLQISSFYEAERTRVKQAETYRQMNITATGFNSMATIADAFYRISGNKNKVAFKAFQVMKSGETIVSTASAAMKAFDDGAKTSFYYGAALAAATVAAGAVQMSAIWGASPDGGGSAPGVSVGVGSGSPGSTGVTQPVTQPRETAVNFTFSPTYNGPVDDQSMTRWTEDYLLPTLRDLKTRGVSA